MDHSDARLGIGETAAGSWIGRSVPRLDGQRYVSGKVRYSADLIPPGALFVALVRSPHACARIEAIDAEAARALPGVIAVVDGWQAEALSEPMPQVLPFPQPNAGRPIVGRCLAVDTTCYAGQPVAAIVAENQGAADAAADCVTVRYQPLPAVRDAGEALAGGVPIVHPGWASNVVATDQVRAGDAATAILGATHVVRGQVAFRPSTAAPMETLCYIGDWDARTGRLTLTGTFQNPHASRWLVATSLRLRETDVRVVAPAMGGTFGFKMSGHPEEALVGLLSRLLGRAVAYVESRADTLLGQSREQVHEFELAADADGRMVAFRDTFVADVGTVGPGNGMDHAADHGDGVPDRVRRAERRGVVHAGSDQQGALAAHPRLRQGDRQPGDGAGRRPAGSRDGPRPSHPAGAQPDPPGSAAAPAAVRPQRRQRRLSGSARPAEGAVRLADWRGRQAAAAGSDLRIGIGIGFELTPEGGARPGAFPSGFETASIRMSPTGDVQVALGVTSPGSGNETGIAQLVGSVLGLPPDAIRVIQGDTDLVPVGTGNASSRAMLYGGAAAHLAATDLRDKLAICAGNVLQAAPDQIVFADGQARAPGGGSVGIAELALGAHTHPFTIGDGVELPLEATRSYRARNIQVHPDGNGRIATYSSFPCSAHAAAVELDAGTGRVRVLDYAAVHDCGVMVNPGLVTGQLKGAIAMGIGTALWEELTYHDDGRLRSDRLKAYLLPRAPDLPPIRVGHMATPSPFHPLGMKGAGESGLGGALAAVFNAVGDALGSASARLATVPATPPRLLAILAEALP